MKSSVSSSPMSQQKARSMLLGTSSYRVSVCVGTLKAREDSKVLSDTEGNLHAISSWAGSGLACCSCGLKFSH